MLEIPEWFLNEEKQRAIAVRYDRSHLEEAVLALAWAGRLDFHSSPAFKRWWGLHLKEHTNTKIALYRMMYGGSSVIFGEGDRY